VRPGAAYANQAPFVLQQNQRLEALRNRVKRVQDSPARFEPKLRSGLFVHLLS
jgi:uncharacterized protein (DUF1015 family)